MTVCSTTTQSFVTTKVFQTVPMTILYLSLTATKLIAYTRSDGGECDSKGETLK